MRKTLVLIALLMFSSVGFAGKEEDRKLYQYRWYSVEAIREDAVANHPKSMGWVFPVGRRYVLEGEGEHSPGLARIDIKPELYRVGGSDFFIHKPDEPLDVSQEVDKLCMLLFRKKLRWIGGESGGFSHFKTYPYEVIGIESNVLAEAPLDIYYSKKRAIVAKKPDAPNSLLCSVYTTPKRGGKVSYQAVVVLTAKAVYGKSK